MHPDTYMHHYIRTMRAYLPTCLLTYPPTLPTHPHMHACMHACMHTYIHMYIYTYVHTYIQTGRQVTYVYTVVYIYTYIHLGSHIADHIPSLPALQNRTQELIILLQSPRPLHPCHDKYQKTMELQRGRALLNSGPQTLELIKPTSCYII